METLYDLLGALPRDDAEELRTAFRRAVKGAHPDLNPGDPDAGQKFREIVRANEILTDEEQRAAYDHLLVLAQKEQKKQTTAEAMHKAATSVIALTVAAGLSVISYLLVLREPALADTLKYFAEVATARPSDFAGLPRPAAGKPQSVALAETGTDSAPTQGVAAPAASSNPLAAQQQAAAGVPSDVIVPVVVTPITITPVAATRPAGLESAMASVGPPLEIAPPPDAHSYRERGISAYRSGDLDEAMADFDHAIHLDPKFSAAYIDRGILLYRLQKFERAFADIAQAKRIERARNAKAAKDAARKQKPPQAAMVLGVPPVFQRHTAKLE